MVKFTMVKLSKYLVIVSLSLLTALTLFPKDSDKIPRRKNPADSISVGTQNSNSQAVAEQNNVSAANDGLDSLQTDSDDIVPSLVLLFEELSLSLSQIRHLENEGVEVRNILRDRAVPTERFNA